MKKLFRYFSANHTLAWLFTIMFITFGIKSLVTFNRDMFPDADFGTVIVTTYYMNASPEDIELNITNKIEDSVKGINGIDYYTSVSLESQSVVTIVLDPDYDDPDDVKNKIREAINRINDFPSDLEDLPVVQSLDTSIFPLMLIGLSANSSYEVLRQEAKLFETKLLNLSEIATIDKISFRDREMQIDINPKKLTFYELSLNSISQAIQIRNQRSSLGTLETKNNEENLYTNAEMNTKRDVENLILRSTFSGDLVRLRDVATIKQGFEDETVITHVNGKKAIGFLVNKSGSADIIDTAEKIKKLINETQDSYKERNMDSFELIYGNDFSKYVKNRFAVVKSNGSAGLFLLLIVLALFLNWRASFWVAISIPVTILGTFTILPFFIDHIDILSLAAMIVVMGVVVDDSIIVSENIIRHREMGEPPLEAAMNGINDVFKPVLTTILTTFIAFAPMFIIPGLIGKFIIVIPLVISIALFVSLLEVTIALPAHLVPSIKGIKPVLNQAKPSRYVKIKKGFESMVRKSLRFRYLNLFLFIVLLTAALMIGKTMDLVFFPADDAEEFNIKLEMDRGTPLELTLEKTLAIESLVADLSTQDIMSYVTYVGLRGRRNERSITKRFSTIEVYLTPFSQRDSKRTAKDIVEKLRQKTDLMTGIKEIEYNIEQGGPPAGKAIEIRIAALTDQDRYTAVSTLISLLNENFDNTVTDINRNDELGKDQIELAINYEALSRYGLSVSTIMQTVSTAFRGSVITSSQLNDEKLYYRVQLDKTYRNNIATLYNLPISNAQGRLIKLSDIVTFKKKAGVPNYYHYDGDRTTTLTANLEGKRYTPLEVQRTLEKLLETSPQLLPTGVQLDFGGRSEETANSFRELGATFMIALIGIFLLLVLLFNSLSLPFLVLLSVPFGIIGIIFAFFFHGEPLGFMAMIGSIGLTGVLVNDSLVLIYRIQQLRALHTNDDIQDIIAEATSDRLRPIFLTSLTTVVGVMPIAYGLSGASDPFIAPLGLTLGWGLVFSTPLILTLLPTFYMINYDLHTFFSSIISFIKRKL
ncbi:AcrB/AcrD/AcrF family protein [Candidatus Marinamargulisbacteria bacterium SCGC AG-333-B06]|nr:AcrB/AcrD/AcrF family protein [Candidatus Marinamargulisbacteria bacterium SCGC AG-333-B06]